jgi:RNA polymerase sigma factor (sigma-70 family)
MRVEALHRVTDEMLVERFVQERDEQAFAELVRRHGPMVRATCRRLLGSAPELDDAFQAAFLVLARKAGTIRLAERLGPWLHTVAVRAARKARQLRLRRQQRERTGTPMPEPVSDSPRDNPWLAQVDDALEQLPAKYRLPLVLCELQGFSRAEAAARLAVPPGTLSSRLARARELLRLRLVRRGFAVSAGAFAALNSGASAGVPPALVALATQAALAGPAPAGVAAITEGVLRTMVLTQLKWFVAVSLACILLLGGLGLGAWRLSAQLAGPQAKSDKELLQGTWKVTAAKKNGQAINDDELAQIKMLPVEFKGDTVTARGPCDYKLDPAKTPKEIDVIPQEGPPGEKGLTFRGIYELKGDDLRICFRGPGLGRPKNFDDAEGAQTMEMTLKRVKDGK